MYTRRIVYYIGCGVLFLCCSALAIANEGIEYPFIQNTSYISYPVYFVLGSPTIDSNNNSLRSVPNSVQSFFKVNFLDSDCNFITNNSAALTKQSFLTAIFSAFADSFDFQPITDFSSNLGVSSDLYICQIPQFIDIVSTNVDVTQNKYMVLMGFEGYSTIRTVRVSGENIPKYFDVFFYGQIGRPGISIDNQNNEVSIGGVYCYNNGTQQIFPPNSGAVIDCYYTYQLCASFRMDKDGKVISYDKKGFGLPFWFNKQTRTIEYCTGKNGYWSGNSASEYPSILRLPFFTNNFISLPFQRFYTELNLSTVSASYNLSRTDSIPFSLSLDTDNGGMSDYHEWYQTGHDLLDPADDSDDTEEPPVMDNPTDNPLEDIPEGESVVDIGKDTIERYKYLLDSTVGDSDELPSVNAPVITDPDNFELENFSIPSLARSITTNAESSLQSYQGRLNDLFSPMSSGVQAPDLTFDPSVHLPSLNTSLSLDPVSLNPTSILGFNTRAAVSYAAPFAPFRAILLVAQSLLFIWCCIKLVFNTMAPGSSGENDT